MPLPVLTLGVMRATALQARHRAIAQGHFTPGPDDPKIWFTAIQTLADLLSDERRALLDALDEHQPESVLALSQWLGQPVVEVHQQLGPLVTHGLVEMRDQPKGPPRPVAKANVFHILVQG